MGSDSLNLKSVVLKECVLDEVRATAISVCKTVTMTLIAYFLEGNRLHIYKIIQLIISKNILSSFLFFVTPTYTFIASCVINIYTMDAVILTILWIIAFIDAISITCGTNKTYLHKRVKR